MGMERIGKKSHSTEKRHWITFQQRTQVADGEGGHTDTWTDFLSVFAAVYPYRADQIFNYRSVNVDATHLIKTDGYLQLPTNTKKVGEIWTIIWSGIAGTTVRIHYQINGGSWVQIESSTSNDGSYSWTIPPEAIGRNVVVRVMHASLSTSYVLTDAYLIVAAAIVSRSVNEFDRIYFDSRVFEILTIEDVQERHFKKFISCKEVR